MVSPSFPHMGTKIALARMYAVAIHPASVNVMPKSLIILGMARFTMVWSNLPRNVPIMTVRSIHQRRLSETILPVHPHLGGHAVLELRIRLGVEQDVHIEILLLPRVRYVEHDIGCDRGLPDALDHAIVLLARESVRGEYHLLPWLDVLEALVLLYGPYDPILLGVDHLHDRGSGRCELARGIHDRDYYARCLREYGLVPHDRQLLALGHLVPDTHIELLDQTRLRGAEGDYRCHDLGILYVDLVLRAYDVPDPDDYHRDYDYQCRVEDQRVAFYRVEKPLPFMPLRGR